MATTPRSGVGGKIVAKRREQRLATTPYDRPAKNPSWFTGIVIPSARRLASGAGKILSSILSESESESLSSEDDGDASDGDLNDVSFPGTNALSEKNAAPSQNMHGIQTKQLIEKLIGQESFSREEFDRLSSVLRSRVVDCSLESAELAIAQGNVQQTMSADDGDIHDRAIQEAKRWFQDKREGSSTPDIKLASGNIMRSSSGIDHASHGEGSPIDVARSYMKERAPWTSPTRHAELQTPLAMTKKFFEEGTTRPVGYDSFSSSKNTLKRSYLASGSWNIEEEKRRVRSKALDDLLRASSSKVDPLSFSVGLPRESLGTGQALFSSGEKKGELESLKKSNPTTVLLDASKSSGPSLTASRQDDIAQELFPSATIVQTKDQEAVRAEVECTAEKPVQLPSPSFPEENHTDTHSLKVNEPATETSGNPIATNGFFTSNSSMAEVADTTVNNIDHENTNNAALPPINKPSSTTEFEGDSVLSETHMEEVPVLMEAVMGSGVQHEPSLPPLFFPRSQNRGSRVNKHIQNEEEVNEGSSNPAASAACNVSSCRENSKFVKFALVLASCTLMF